MYFALEGDWESIRYNFRWMCRKSLMTLSQRYLETFGLYWKLEFTRLIDYWTFFLCEYIVFVFTTASKCYSVLVTCVLSWRVSEAMLVHCEMRCRGTVTPINSSTKQQGSRWLSSHGTFLMVAWSNTKCTYCPGIHVCLSTVSLWMK